MKYKVGDKVRVKSYRRLIDEYPVGNDGFLNCGAVYFNPVMAQYCGKELTISGVYNEQYYKTLDGGDWSYSDEMLEDSSFCDDSVSFDPECITALRHALQAMEEVVSYLEKQLKRK